MRYLFAVVLALLTSITCSQETGIGLDARLKELSKEDLAYVSAMIKHKGELPAKLFNQLMPGDVCKIALWERERTVSQVIDGNNLIVGSNSLWVEGVDTSSISEDEVVELGAVPFYFVGNKQYTTVLGATKTLKHCIAVGSNTANDIVGERLHLEGIEIIRNIDGRVVGAGKVVRKSKTKIQLKGQGKAVYRLDVSEIYPTDARRIIGAL